MACIYIYTSFRLCAAKKSNKSKRKDKVMIIRLFKSDKMDGWTDRLLVQCVKTVRLISLRRISIRLTRIIRRITCLRGIIHLYCAGKGRCPWVRNKRIRITVIPTFVILRDNEGSTGKSFMYVFIQSTFCGSSPRSLITAHDWDANASFSSNKSTSSIFQLAFWSCRGKKRRQNIFSMIIERSL